MSNSVKFYKLEAEIFQLPLKESYVNLSSNVALLAAEEPAPDIAFRFAPALAVALGCGGVLEAADALLC